MVSWRRADLLISPCSRRGVFVWWLSVCLFLDAVCCVHNIMQFCLTLELLKILLLLQTNAYAHQRDVGARFPNSRCLMVWVSTLIPGTDPQVPQLSISSLCSRPSSSFGFHLCLRNIFTPNTLLLIWNFGLDVKQANGDNKRVFLVGLVNLISLFLNKPGVPSSQPSWLRAPIPAAARGTGSAPSKPSLVKSKWQRKDPHHKKKSLSRNALSYFRFTFSLWFGLGLVGFFFI